MKPLVLDLCCGLGGWTNGLLEAGWDVIGVDIEEWPGYQGTLIISDVREFEPSEYMKRNVKLVVASPPCQDFSYSSLPFKKARAKFSKENPPNPDIWNACVRIAKELNAPLILENVSGARKWMGPATWHYGSFYFWGELPALIPIGCPRKGFGRGKHLLNPSDTYGGFCGRSEGVKKMSGWNKPEVQDMRKRPKNFMPGEYERKNPVYQNISEPRDKFKKMVGSEKHRKIHGAEQVGKHKSSLRKQWSATVAMIPIELSTWIGECFKPKEERKNNVNV